jgi:hypothetical protein
MADHGFLKCERHVIYTADLSLQKVESTCPTTKAFLEAVVRPIRTPDFLDSFPGLAQRWWQFHRPAAELYRTVSENSTFLVIGMVTKYIVPARLPSDWIATNKLCLFAEDRAGVFGILLCSFVDAWLRKMSGSLGETLSVSIQKGVNTLPLPLVTLDDLTDLEHSVEQLQKKLLAHYGDGYTGLYNRFHNTDESSADIQKLRELHVEMDNAVAAAYGWTDLNLDHGFHETKQGTRYTISEPARREVLQRLLKLNHERYAEELKQGLHSKNIGKARPKKASKSTGSDHNTLF